MKLMKLLSLTLLFVVTRNMFGNTYDINSSSCNKVRQCSKNTLYRDGFNLQFHAGASPIIWANRGCMSFLSTGTSACSSVLCPNSSTNCSAGTNCVEPIFIDSLSCTSDCVTPAISSIQTPKFNKLFQMPWAIGATLGYAISTHHEVFFEFNYTQASKKHASFAARVTNASAVPVLLNTNLAAKYKNASAYFGYRYNFDRMRCFPRDFLGDMAWFLGIKAGILHHFGIQGFITSSFINAAVSTTPLFDIFKKNTSFSGAGEVGVDICLNCDWSLMVAAEVAAAWGPSCHHIVIPVTELSSLSIVTPKIGAEILFPVTFGLRYKF